MTKISRIHNIDVSSASFPISLLLASDVNRYKIYGTKALSVDVAINPLGTAKEGMVVTIDYSGTITTTVAVSRFGDYSFTIFGTKVPYSWLAKKLKIWCEYHNSAWGVFILPSIDSIPNIKLEMLDTSDILDDSTLTYDGTTGKMKVKDAGVTATQLGASAVEESNVKAKAISLTKMADLARGSLIVGGVSDAPTALVGKTSGYLLIGDGTDVVAVAVSGDVTIAADGTVTIGADKVLSAMIKAGELMGTHLNAAAAVAFTQMAVLTASKIPVLNASGFIEAGSVAATKLTYIDVTTPGTAEASKALVLSAAKKIDEIDPTSLKINGTTVNATATEMNYLVGVTGLIQDQLDAGSSLVNYTTVVADTTVVAANLKALYIADTVTAGGTITVTLPLASTVTAGFKTRLVRIGAGFAASFARNAADNLYPVTSMSVDQATISPSGTGKGIDLVCNGIDTWQCVFAE